MLLHTSATLVPLLNGGRVMATALSSFVTGSQQITSRLRVFESMKPGVPSGGSPPGCIAGLAERAHQKARTEEEVLCLSGMAACSESPSNPMRGQRLWANEVFYNFPSLFLPFFSKTEVDWYTLCPFLHESLPNIKDRRRIL